jgi:serine/threonine-protein kinase
MARLKVEFPNSSLDATGNRLYALLCDTRPSKVRYLGMAHGLGGYYFSLLEWATLSGSALPPWFWTDVDRLIGDAEGSGPTIKWPIARGALVGSHRYMHGWCNGGPGLALLWARAYETTVDTRFLELARGCGRHVLAAVPYFSNLCCGKAGAAYALLALSRIEPDEPWKSPALELAARAIRHERLKSWNESLFKGRAGLLCLALDLLDRRRPSHFPCVEVPVRTGDLQRGYEGRARSQAIEPKRCGDLPG